MIADAILAGVRGRQMQMEAFAALAGEACLNECTAKTGKDEAATSAEGAKPAILRCDFLLNLLY